jgi:hypothetical protein
MNTADIVFPQRIEGETILKYIRRATQYTRLGTPDTLGDKVKVRPNRQHYIDAEHAPVPCTIDHMAKCIQTHNADELRQARFKLFCFDDGIPENGQVVNEDGSIDYYAPDAMGYPTLVMRKDANGESV